MRADADQGVGAEDASGFLDRQIVLAEMDAVSIVKLGDVGPIIDDEERAGGARYLTNREPAPTECGRQLLLAQLDYLGPPRVASLTVPTSDARHSASLTSTQSRASASRCRAFGPARWPVEV